MWSLDYVQVPKQEKLSTPKKEVGKSEQKEEEIEIVKIEAAEEAESDNEIRRKRVQTLVHQMSVSTELTNTEEGLIAKSGSESSLSEDDKVHGKENTAEKEEKERCSGKEDEDENDNDKNAEKISNNLRVQIELRKRLSFDNKSKSEELENSLLREPKYNIWRRSSCTPNLQRQEEISIEEAETSVKSGRNLFNLLTISHIFENPQGISL